MKKKRRYYIKRDSFEIIDCNDDQIRKELEKGRDVRSYPWYGTKRPSHDIIKFWDKSGYNKAIELLEKIKTVNLLLSNPRSMVKNEDGELNTLGKLLVEKICREHDYKNVLKQFLKL